MKYPEIEDMITTNQALELCKHFNLDYLIKRIETNSEKYKEWEFDGCSGLPDEKMAGIRVPGRSPDRRRGRIRDAIFMGFRPQRLMPS